jgi:hypothetical protein
MMQQCRTAYFATMNPRSITLLLIGLLAIFVVGCTSQRETSCCDALTGDAAPFVLAVMDPQAVDFARPCVPSFAQRQYRVLAPVLAEALGRTVELQFLPSLEQHLEKSPTGKVDLVVGKVSTVRACADRLQMSLSLFGTLTDAEGKTMHHGIFVVPSDDEEAQTIADLKSYTIFFGSPSDAEKYTAAMATLADHGIEVPENRQTFATALDAVFELYNVERSAAVITDHERIALEECRTIEKGSLRTIGNTREVPFIAFFLAGHVEQQDHLKIISALGKIKEDEALRKALDTKDGVQFL